MSKPEIHNGKKLLLWPKRAKKCPSLIWLKNFMHHWPELRNAYKISLISIAVTENCAVNFQNKTVWYRSIFLRISTASSVAKYRLSILAARINRHKQITGIFYVGQQEPRAFYTIFRLQNSWSNCYLGILKDISGSPESRVSCCQNFTCFFTDGPVTKYRQKKNFYLFSTLLQNYSFLTWNFWEASHGKGPADGIGAALKRSADKLIREGTDIPSAEAMFEKL